VTADKFGRKLQLSPFQMAEARGMSEPLTAIRQESGYPSARYRGCKLSHSGHPPAAAYKKRIGRPGAGGALSLARAVGTRGWGSAGLATLNPGDDDFVSSLSGTGQRIASHSAAPKPPARNKRWSMCSDQKRSVDHQGTVPGCVTPGCEQVAILCRAGNYNGVSGKHA
jgi:hypothetical protein